MGVIPSRGYICQRALHLQILLTLALARLSGCACLKTLSYRIATSPLEIGRVSQHVFVVNLPCLEVLLSFFIFLVRKSISFLIGRSFLVFYFPCREVLYLPCREVYLVVLIRRSFIVPYLPCREVSYCYRLLSVSRSRSP